MLPKNLVVILLLLGFANVSMAEENESSPGCATLTADIRQAMSQLGETQNASAIANTVLNLSFYQSSSGSIILKVLDNPLTLRGVHPSCQLRATLTKEGIKWSNKTNIQ
jgi:hypothetical protein